MNPLEFITGYHILALHLAALLRLLVAYDHVSRKLKKDKKNFVWQIYFGDRWDNWLAHIISMWLLLMTLPSLVELSGEWIPVMKEVKDNPSINMLATGAVGFFGYDGVKWLIGKFRKNEVK